MSVYLDHKHSDNLAVPLDFIALLRQNIDENHPECSARSLQVAANTMMRGVVDTLPHNYVKTCQESCVNRQQKEAAVMKLHEANLASASPVGREASSRSTRKRLATDKEEETQQRETSQTLGNRARSAWSKHD